MPWKYDFKLYKRHNEVEHFFLRFKRFCKVFTRYDKLDVIYFSAVTLALRFVISNFINELAVEQYRQGTH